MSGLVWSALGQGISSLGGTMGSIMAREADREDRQEEQRRRDEERRAATERENQRNRDLRMELAAGKGSADSPLSMADIGEGGKAEGLVARLAGMTVPELRARRKLSETGDTEPFKQDTTQYKPEVEGEDTTDAVSRKFAKQMDLTETIRSLPPGFEAEAKAKAQALAKIEESLVLGGKYSSVTQGRVHQQQVDKTEEAIRSPERAGIIGQGVAAGKGNDIVGGDSNVTRNKFTGDTSVTPVGESQRQENLAQAGQASAAARLSGAKADAIAAGEDPEVVNAKTADLQRKINAAKARLARELGVADNEVNSALLSLSRNKSADAQTRFEKAKPFIDRLDEAQAAMDNWQPGKTKPKEAKPAPAAAPAPSAAASGKSKDYSKFWK